jgi:hypothetical protein
MRSVVGIAAIIATATLACGDATPVPQSASPDSGNTPPVTASPAAQATARAAEQAPPPAVVAEHTLDQAVRIAAQLAEWSITLSRDTVTVGEYALVIENKGARPHVIEMRGSLGGYYRSLPIAPGSTTTLSMPLGPGTYQLSSTDTTYAQRGMRARLVVIDR